MWLQMDEGTFKFFFKSLLSLLHYYFCFVFCCCCCSVTKSRLTLCDPMDCSTPGLPVPHHLHGVPKFTSTESVMSSNLLILSHPLLLPSIFPSIRVFSSESAVHIRWPKYWRFSFSINPSEEYMVLISFKIDWFWSPWCPRDSQESSAAPQFKNITSSALCLLYCLPSSYLCTWLQERP